MEFFFFKNIHIRRCWLYICMASLAIYLWKLSKTWIEGVDWCVYIILNNATIDKHRSCKMDIVRGKHKYKWRWLVLLWWAQSMSNFHFLDKPHLYRFNWKIHHRVVVVVVARSWVPVCLEKPMLLLYVYNYLYIVIWSLVCAGVAIIQFLGDLMHFITICEIEIGKCTLQRVLIIK